MGRRITRIATLALALSLAGFASAGPFDRSAESFGVVVNGILEQAGSDLRFRLDQCSSVPQIRCRFAARRVAAVVQGRDASPSIRRIIIATDLLQDHPSTLPHETVTDALITLGATMMAFDPELPAEQRDQLILSLAGSVHSTGQGEGSGVDADYVITLEQGAGALLAIIITPKVGR